MIIAGRRGFTVAATASLLGEGDGRLYAWAERHIRQDPDLRWILGNYVEATEPNSNGHIFPLDELVVAQDTLAGKPLNMMHREHYIVGAFAGAQLLHADGREYQAGDAQQSPTTAAINLVTMSATDGTYTSSTTNSFEFGAAAAPLPPYVEALAGLWHTRFPEEFFNIKRAHSEGQLFFSMESVPEEVSCPTCSHRTAFAGLEHDTYCEHMQGAVGPKILHKPTFNGGAIIIPPVKPGWSRADITVISKLIVDEAESAEQIYDATAEAAAHLGPREWETVMAQILQVATADA